MPTRKYRRTIDPRVASLARQISKSAATNERLQEALLAVAISACMVSTQTQALLAVCKTAGNAFATCDVSGELADKGGEVFGRLGEGIVQATEGIFTESLESLVAMASEAVPADQRLRTLVTLAAASGLDPSQIALDYEEQSSDVPEPKKDAPLIPSNVEYNIFSIESFTEVCSVRRLSELRISNDADGKYLVGLGFDGRTWYRVTRLQCDDQEAERVAQAVRNRLSKRS